MANISIEDRDSHIRAVIKSNLVGLGLDANVIESTTQNLYVDITDVLYNFEKANTHVD